MARKSEYVVAFKDVGKEDVALVGGKGANLGEMTRAGSKQTLSSLLKPIITSSMKTI
jgi:dTDP-glucose pyrophosphorylase